MYQSTMREYFRVGYYAMTMPLLMARMEVIKILHAMTIMIMTTTMLLLLLLLLMTMAMIIIWW